MGHEGNALTGAMVAVVMTCILALIIAATAKIVLWLF